MKHIAAILALFVLCSPAFAQESATYHPYSIEQIVKANPANWGNLHLTHVEVTGYIAYKKHESDGDWHLLVCDALPGSEKETKHFCLVAEIIPELPLMVPNLGAKITADGIYRYDAENPGHHWAELHPVTKISAATNGVR